ncbi:hypothetical protein HDU79_006427 [Rhizoclosmatium sp. JEL0117]|nr:hypothetical protein HDU79_006427 [Rhizoclosmatium sp. JEL0117]
MNDIATQDILWKQLCKTRWASKKHQDLSIHPFVDCTPILNKLTRPEKLRLLQRRVFKQPGIELEPDDVLDTLVIQTTPHWIEGVYVYVPVRCGKWQASYIAAELDRFRVDLTKVELCLYEWEFSLGGDPEKERIRFWQNGWRGLDDTPEIVETWPYKFPYQFVNNKLKIGPWFLGPPVRLDNWGWEFDYYAVYTSVDPERSSASN